MRVSAAPNTVFVGLSVGVVVVADTVAEYATRVVWEPTVAQTASFYAEGELAALIDARVSLRPYVGARVAVAQTFAASAGRSQASVEVVATTPVAGSKREVGGRRPPV